MKIEKVNHFLTKVFVVALVITQVILFVAIQVAVKGSQQLPVQFISPIAGQEITIGQSIELEAVIDVGSYDFDVVYFVVESDEFDVSLQFQAINQGNNNWIADSSWQTDNYSVGDYQVSILAQIFDDNGVIIDTQESSAIIISLIEATLPLAAKGGTSLARS